MKEYEIWERQDKGKEPLKLKVLRIQGIFKAPLEIDGKEIPDAILIELDKEDLG